MLKSAIELIHSSNRILLVSHRRPDGDTLGASVGLYLAIKALGKKAVLACMDDIPRRLRFIPETDRFVHEFDLREFDLIIISDAGAYHMTGFHERYADFLSKKIPILNIDHHASNEGFGSVNIIDTQASSATMIVWKLLKAMNLPITKDIALALLAGIYNDTGGFIHSNTTQETFEIASDLAKTGVDISGIVRPMFRESTTSQLRLWGYILENAHVNEKGVLASVVSEADLRGLGAHGSDTGGIVDLLNTVPEASFVMLLAEDEGMVKGSLRTQRDDVNVSDIAVSSGAEDTKKRLDSGFTADLKNKPYGKSFLKPSRSEAKYAIIGE